MENQGTGGEGTSGDVEAPPRAQQVLESKNLLENLRDDRLQSPRRKQSAINGRPSGLHRSTVVMVDCRKSRLSTDGDSFSRSFSVFQLSIAIRTNGQPSEAIGRPLGGQQLIACRLSQAILPTLIKILQMTQMTQENRKVTQYSRKYKCDSTKYPHGSGNCPSHGEGLKVSSPICIFFHSRVVKIL